MTSQSERISAARHWKIEKLSSLQHAALRLALSYRVFSFLTPEQLLKRDAIAKRFKVEGPLRFYWSRLELWYPS